MPIMNKWDARSKPLENTVLGKAFQHHSIMANNGIMNIGDTPELTSIKGIVWKYHE